MAFDEQNDRRDKQGLAQRVATKTLEKHIPKPTRAIGTSPKAAAPSNTVQNHLQSDAADQHELEDIQNVLTYLALRLEGTKRRDDDGRVREGIVEVEEKDKSRWRGGRRGNTVNYSGITKRDIPVITHNASAPERSDLPKSLEPPREPK